ncbi:MAG: exo-beta-1,3-glucanase, partial [Okeania sp. SIO3C4]|nr:exo-beta-1,3-glucanase [Okeania sp. SIO3C4]
MMSCSSSSDKTAAEILGNPEYLAMSYGGYREKTRKNVPSVADLKQDMKILSAMGIRVIRTYNTQQFAQAEHILKAIRELKEESPSFEMYVMLGAWIDCKGAWTDNRNHTEEHLENNTKEIEAAVTMANEYPDIVKMIAVGNEAMVHWASSYFIHPKFILKWVNYLQNLKKEGKLSKDVWITSSDNHASWGSEKAYRTDDLQALMKAVDFISLHTYPFHDTHYNSAFWLVPENEEALSEEQKTDAAIQRAVDYAKMQYQNVAGYVESLGIKKPIHIGETGWATKAATHYGSNGSHAADELKEKLYYEQLRKWTNGAGISLFYFEAFDEQWKDAGHPLGSENHFGLIKLNGEAKYALWDMVDAGAFEGLMRSGKKITKTYGGDKAKLMEEVLAPLGVNEVSITELKTTNGKRKLGEPVTEQTLVVYNPSVVPNENNNTTYPSIVTKLNTWEGSCMMELKAKGAIEVHTGTGNWWGCALQVLGDGRGENLSEFENGYLNFDLKGETQAIVKVGFKTGQFS